MRLAPLPAEGEEAEPSTIDPVLDRLKVYPDLRFKLDPTNHGTTS